MTDMRCKAYLGSKRKRGRCGSDGDETVVHSGPGARVIPLCAHHVRALTEFGIWKTTLGDVYPVRRIGQ